MAGPRTSWFLYSPFPAGLPRSAAAVQRARLSAGFTLLELMVAVVLFVVALLALTQVVVVVSDVRRIDEQHSAVARMAAEELLAIENTPFEDILATHHGRRFSVYREGAEGELLKPLPDDPDGLPGEVEVHVLHETSEGIHLVEVVVSVDWTSRRGPQHSERRTRISRFGVKT